MAEHRVVHARKAIGDRNVEAILDAVERLIRRGSHTTFSAIAKEAGVSRPTVYSHFDDRSQLFAALVARTARQATTAVDAADPDEGPALDGLRRVISAGWEHLARHQEIARVAIADVSHEAVHAAHYDARVMIKRLIERGRTEDAFRTDLPAEWLATSCVALIHAATEAVHAGQMDARSALEALIITVQDLCQGRERSTPPMRRTES
jgi:AcrR family transcriptional regulator